LRWDDRIEVQRYPRKADRMPPRRAATLTCFIRVAAQLPEISFNYEMREDVKPKKTPAESAASEVVFFCGSCILLRRSRLEAAPTRARCFMAFSLQSSA
jgi:hypothetical protein